MNTNTKQKTKVAAIALGTTVASVAGLNTAIHAEDVEQPNFSATDTSTSQHDQMINDLSNAHNNVAQAQSELTSIEQEVSTQQGQTDQARQEAQEAQTNFGNASDQATSAIETETKDLETKIGNAENKIQENENTIQGLEKKNTEKENVITDAQKDVDEKEITLENAKEVAKTVSEQDITDAKTVLDNATADKETKANALDGVQNQATTLENEIASNKTALSDAQVKLDQAITAQNEVQSVYDAAKEKVETAQKVYDAILNGTAVDKVLLDKAKVDVEAAQSALTQAQTDLENARTSIETIKSNIAQTQSDITRLENALTAEKEKQKQVDALAQQVSDKEKDVEQKQTTLTNAQNEKTSLENQITNKQNELNNTKSKKTTKEGQLKNVQDELDLVKDKIANPSKYEVVKDAERQSSLGFFKSLGLYGEAAVKYLSTNQKSSEYDISSSDTTHLAQKGDATSLESMKESLKFIKKCNELRKSEGKSELRISPYLMAVAQVQANMSAVKFDHHKTVLVGENLAWGYSDPFNGWYTQEKNNYLTNNGGQTGHYLNIIKDKYYGTGYGINSATYGYVHSQTFLQQANLPYFKDPNTGKYVSTRDTYSVDEFERLFMAYYNANKVETIDVEALKIEQGSLESQIQTLQSTISSLDSKINGLNSEINALINQKNEVDKNVDTAQNQFNVTKAELDTLKNQYNTAKANCDVEIAQQNVNDAKSRLTTLNSNLKTAQNYEKETVEAEKEAQTRLADANQALKDLEPDLDRATSVLNSAKADLEAITAELNAKKEETTHAQESVDTLTTSLKEKEDAKVVVDKQIETLTAEKEVAEGRLADAQAEYDRLVEIRDAVSRLEKEIIELKDTIEKAQMSIDVNNAHITTLRQENKNLNEVLPSYNEALSIVQAYGKALNLAVNGEEYTIDFDEEGLYQEYAEMILSVSQLRATAEEKEGVYREEQAKLDALQPSYQNALNKLVEAEKELAEKEKTLQDYVDQLLNTHTPVNPPLVNTDILTQMSTTTTPGAVTPVTTTGTAMTTTSVVNRPVVLDNRPTITLNGRELPRAEEPFKDVEAKGADSETKKEAAQKEVKPTTNENQVNIPVGPIAGGVLVAGGIAAFLAKKKLEDTSEE